MIIRGHISLISLPLSLSLSLPLSQKKKPREVSRDELNLFIKGQSKHLHLKAPAIVKGF
jgi:hypothetical protein